MSTFIFFCVLCALIGILVLWNAMQAAYDKANLIAQKETARRGVQLLDGTVGLNRFYVLYRKPRLCLQISFKLEYYYTDKRCDAFLLFEEGQLIAIKGFPGQAGSDFI